ncbi:MAG: hypothetical protein KKF56_05620 [Nanoarchaeota archaeon]|nr:hypothetical protein [Nanoarchaeota archaeon]
MSILPINEVDSIVRMFRDLPLTELEKRYYQCAVGMIIDKIPHTNIREAYRQRINLQIGGLVDEVS